MDELAAVYEIAEASNSLAAIKVYRQLCRKCERYEQPCFYERQCTLVKTCAMPEATVRVALDWLEANGWIARCRQATPLGERTVLWCLWLLPSGELDHARYDLGQGVYSGPEERPEELQSPHLARPKNAMGCAKKAHPIATENLSLDSLGINHVSVNANANVAAPRGGGEEIPEPIQAEPIQAEPIQAAPVEPPRPPSLTEAEIQARLAELANPNGPRFLRVIAACALATHGLLPATYAELVAALPEASPPPEPKLTPRMVPAATPPAIGPATLETLIRRLPGGPVETIEARCREVADRMGEEFQDWGSIHGFLPKLRRAALGEIPLKAILRGYGLARKCGRDAVPGKIFHHSINQTLGGLRE